MIGITHSDVFFFKCVIYTHTLTGYPNIVAEVIGCVCFESGICICVKTCHIVIGVFGIELTVDNKLILDNLIPAYLVRVDTALRNRNGLLDCAESARV